jgi:myo-inositol 2-dehydrogenase / D-chiro-inositol 1-dehydrogenase
MSQHPTSSVQPRDSRRAFLAQSVLLASTAAGASLVIGRSAHAAGNDTLKLGLIGCGGRGAGAAADALSGDPGTKLWAMADVFGDKIESSIKNLSAEFADRIQVEPARRFAGLEGYRGVIENCDIVLIACASRFHALYGLAAVKAKKHVFIEKPAAVDVAGIHRLLEADELAKKNGTGVLAGLTYRYHLGRREAIERIHNGEIGEIVAIQCDYLRSPYQLIERQPAWSEMEYQFRNWYHFSWLSGDDVPQSLIHNLDSALWAVHDEPPGLAYGMGGRSSHFQAEMGTSFDHHSVIFEYANGRRIYGSVRTAVGCFGNNIDVFHGTKGRCVFAGFAAPKFTDLAGKTTWKADAELSKKSPYRQEHLEFLQSIREGRPFQRGKQLAVSTLTTVLGQLAVYTGRQITWEEGLQSKFAFPPQGEIRMDMEPPVKPGADGIYPVAIPGTTKLI